MEVAMETGTLKEMDVKPGDVVALAGADGYKFTIGYISGDRVYGTSEKSDRQYEDDWSLTATGNWFIISRATTTPDLTAITTPFGLLDAATQKALRAHGGPYEFFSGDNWRDAALEPDEWLNFNTYRAKKEPKRETVTMAVFIDLEGFIQPSYINGLTKRVQVTFDRVDGRIDLATYKVEPR